MGKDFKIGLASGLILAVIGLIWVATRPSLSPEARMLRSSQAAAGEGSAPSHAVPALGPTAAPASRVQPPSAPDAGPLVQAGAGASMQQAPVSPASTVAGRSDQPDLTIYERAEKIKTTRFHIVRKDETLSAIARQYYGSPDKWRMILEANKDRIKDANRIAPGTKLTIPDLD